VRGAATPVGPRVDRAGAPYTPDRSYFAGFPAPRAWFPFAARGSCQELASSIAQGYPYPVKVLLTEGSDWPYAVPGGKALWERAVSNEAALPLFVAISPVLGEAAAWADFVLPESTYLESWSLPTSSAAITTQASALQQPVVGSFDSVTIARGRPLGLRPHRAQRVCAAPPRHADARGHPHRPRQGHLAALPGRRRRRLRARAPARPGVGLLPPPLANLARNVGTELTGAAVTTGDLVARGGAFAAPGSGYDVARGALLRRRHGSVLHFYLPALATTAHSITGRRHRGTAHLDAARHLDGRPVRDAAFPLQLVSYERALHAGERTSVSPWIVAAQPVNFVELAEPDARAADVETGDRVRVTSASNPAGVVGVARVNRSLRPGVVAVARGFGRWEGGARSHLIDGRTTAYDPSRGGGVSALPVLRLDDAAGDVPLEDPVGGGCSFGDTWVRVEPVTAR
jgi:tetrathionate reductase subunit A